MVLLDTHWFGPSPCTCVIGLDSIDRYCTHDAGLHSAHKNIILEHTKLISIVPDFCIVPLDLVCTTSVNKLQRYEHQCPAWTLCSVCTCIDL